MSDMSLEATYLAYLDALNGRRFSDLDEFVHDELTYNDKALTRQEYADMIAADVEAVPDLHFEARLLVACDDVVACRLWFDCTPSGELFGPAPAWTGSARRSCTGGRTSRRASRSCRARPPRQPSRRRRYRVSVSVTVGSGIRVVGSGRRGSDYRGVGDRCRRCRRGRAGSGAVRRCLACAGSRGAHRGGPGGVRPAVAGVDGGCDRAAGSQRGP